MTRSVGDSRFFGLQRSCDRTSLLGVVLHASSLLVGLGVVAGLGLLLALLVGTVVRSEDDDAAGSDCTAHVSAGHQSHRGVDYACTVSVFPGGWRVSHVGSHQRRKVSCCAELRLLEIILVALSVINVAGIAGFTVAIVSRACQPRK